MELSRATRLLRSRWAFVAIAALAGVATALLATDWWNRRIEPQYQATAAVTYVGSDETRLQTGLALALQANADRLASDTQSSISVEEGTTRLLFRATAPDVESARQAALAMRQAFNQSDPAIDEPLIRARLDEIVLELDGLNAPAPLPDSEDTEEAGVDSSTPGFEDDILAAQIGALRQRLSDLAVQLALLGSDPGSQATRPSLEGELARVGQQIDQLEGELASLAVPTEANREELLQQGALEAYRQQLVEEYQNLYLRLLGRDPTTRDDVVTAIDLTPPPKPFLLTASLGGAAGALLAIVFLFLADMGRRPVWSRTDIDPIMPPLVELPPRRRGRRSSKPWYPDAPSGTRKQGIQVIRAGIDPEIGSESVTIGVADMGVGSEQVATLTADLGAALAASGHSILVIDADFGHEIRIPEFAMGGAQLAGVLTQRVGDEEEFLAFIKRAIGDQAEVLPGLRILPAGKLTGDAVDALAGKQFSMLLGEARPAFNAILVTVPEFGHPAAETLSQRLDCILLVAQAGQTPISRLEQAENDLRARPSKLLGAVLLRGRPVRAKTAKGDQAGLNVSARHLPRTGRSRSTARSRPASKSLPTGDANSPDMAAVTPNDGS